MRISKEHEYTAVNLSDEETEADKRRSRRTIPLWKLIWYIEVSNLVIFALMYSGWHFVHRSPYHILNVPLKRNVTQIFTVDKEDLHLVMNTEAANYYWLNITRDVRNGLVSLPISQTEKLGLRGSGLNTIEGEKVFQVDMFHQLHCLQRIRSDLISAKYLYQLNPNRSDDDPYSRHTLHCVDYLRQAVMCTGDMTLVSTGTDLEFDHSPPRQCRDFEAASEWVLAHRWNYEKHTGMITLGGPHSSFAEIPS